MPNLSSVVTTTIKIGVSVALVTWMISTGKLAPSVIVGAVAFWPLLIVAATAFYVQISITAVRWNLLLAAQEIILPLRDAFSLTMIGALFNVVIPGSVGGDVIKGYYVTRRTEGRKSVAVTTILVDRIIGLLGLVSLAACAAAWNYSGITEPAIRRLCAFTILAALAGIVCVVLAVVIGPRIRVPEKYGHLFAILGRVLAGLLCYRQRPLVLVSAFGLSVVSQAIACWTFYLCAQTIAGADVPFHYLLFIVPVGLVTTAIPLTPAGVGVGQAAFYTLFQLVPGGDPTAGANVFTVYQFIYLLVFLSGLGFYLSYRAGEAASIRESVPAS